MAWPHEITIIAVVSGLVAALVMGTLYTRRLPSEPLPSTTFLARLVGGETPEYEVGGTLLYLLYGGFVGGLYPWTFRGLLELQGKWIIALPNTLLTGLVFGLVLIGPWTILRALGLVDPPFQPTEGFETESDEAKYVTLVGLHIVYGLVLGFLAGLSQGIWYPLFGV